MSFLRQSADLFLDSPTFGRDRAQLMTGFTVGVAALLLNGLVLLFLMPVMLATDEFGFESFNESLDFGQIMALILLVGTTTFATFLIPLRLATVFFEPRISRYFDQIVLSGVSPIRFMIGKVLSQNLYFGLIIFLLAPYMVLSLTLGKVDLSFFTAGIILIWLYCLELALATLWFSLYVNELLAALTVIFLAMTMCIIGCTPIGGFACLPTPFPTIVHPLTVQLSETYTWGFKDFWIVFLVSCLVHLVSISFLLMAVYLGPLYGIVRDNATFGEVVYAGDSRRKRRFRLRFHIQRSSEIAFFYQNRQGWLIRHEGLIRWGVGLAVLISFSVIGYGIDYLTARENVRVDQFYGWIESFHIEVLLTHGFGLALAVILFSHAKNTTYLRLPIFGKATAEVSRLDTWAFLVFLLLSTIGALMIPEIVDRYVALPNKLTVLSPAKLGIDYGSSFDARRFSYEGTAIITIMALVIYLTQRLFCLSFWMKSMAAVGTGILYLCVTVMMPIVCSLLLLGSFEVIDSSTMLGRMASSLAASSPAMALVIAMNGKLGHPFPDNLTTLPFYVVHSILFLGLLLIYRRSAPRVRKLYLIRQAAMVLVLCLGLTSVATAQSKPIGKDIDTAGLTVEAVVGWGGIKQRWSPLPFSFLLTNDSNRPLEGAITLREPISRKELRLGEVYLGPESSRRLTSISDVKDWDVCIATLHHEGRILWRRELDLNPTLTFDSRAKLVLFADREGRNLSFQTASNSNSAVTQSSSFVGKDGWPVDGVNIRPWQFPLHPGPLFAFSAIILSDQFAERDLDRAQWQAVAEWVCQGGTLFAHNSSQAMLDRVLALSPLQADPAVDQGPFHVRRLGLGAIYQFEQPMRQDSDAMTRKIQNIASGLPKFRLNALVNGAHFESHPNAETNRNRYWILGLFGLYMLFSGVGALLLFRLNQRRMATYITCVVATTCISAGVLGGYMQMSRGDLNWLTISQAGAGGLVQVGCIQVQSAGSQNSRVAIRGTNPDLQFIGQPQSRRYYYGGETIYGHPLFSWQPDQNKSDPDVCQIEVPMAAWGNRKCHAVAYRPRNPSLVVELQFNPRPTSSNPPSGTFNADAEDRDGTISLKIDNQTGFDFQSCSLVVSTTQAAPANADKQNQAYGYAYQNVVDGRIAAYAAMTIPQFTTGAKVDTQLGLKFEGDSNRWNFYRFWPHELNWTNGTHSFTDLTQVGVARAWIIGQIRKSPSITIDDTNTDFVTHEGTHLYIQELLPEEIPAALNFSGNEPKAE